MRLSVRIISTICGLALALTAVDQIVKGLVTGALAPGESRPIVDGLLWLTHQHNTGAAFSLLRDAPPALVLTLNAVVMVFFVGLAAHYLHLPAGRVAAVLVLGGALGNLIDRARLHYVIDYLDVRVWPVFNLADAFVVAGVALLVVVMFRAEHHGMQKEAPQ
ncbi:MAG: signal peptidase II [Armatimonadota bacterium]